MEKTPNNTTELMKMAAEALRDGDVEQLLHLKGVTSNWLQSEDETEAQHEMLDAMLEALDY